MSSYSSDSDCEEKFSPIDISGLSEKSRKKYEAVYNSFMDWRRRTSSDDINNDVDADNAITETIVLSYFLELSEKYKSSSLYAKYSMLRSTLRINNGIKIENYKRLRSFLKLQSQGYRAKTAKTFTHQQISEFINFAPDHKFLAVKVALIFGIIGACRSSELHSLNIDQIQDLGSALLVTTMPNSVNKPKVVRRFTVTGQYYAICKKFINLRPSDPLCRAFFLNYDNGKCGNQNIGINKFGSMGKRVASYLGLPNPEEYTGHSFRKSSAAMFVDAEGNIATLQDNLQNPSACSKAPLMFTLSTSEANNTAIGAPAVVSSFKNVGSTSVTVNPQVAFKFCGPLESDINKPTSSDNGRVVLSQSTDCSSQKNVDSEDEHIAGLVRCKLKRIIGSKRRKKIRKQIVSLLLDFDTDESD